MVRNIKQIGFFVLCKIIVICNYVEGFGEILFMVRNNLFFQMVIQECFEKNLYVFFYELNLYFLVISQYACFIMEIRIVKLVI